VLTFEKLSHDGDLGSLREDWNGLVVEDDRGVHGLDVTNTYEWARAVRDLQLARHAKETIVVREQSRVVGVLSCYFDVFSNFRLRKLAPITQINGVRSGWVLQPRSADRLKSLCEHLQQDIAKWDVLVFSVVEDSESHRAVVELDSAGVFQIRELDRKRSPFIALADSIEEQYTRMDKKLAKDVQRRERKLRADGSVRLRVFVEEDETPEFLDAVVLIEQRSWKEDSGTSITQNKSQQELYTTLAPVLASRQWLAGFVLYLNDEPIAYTYGVLFNGVFQNHKTSYVQDLRDKGPGNVLRVLEIDWLCKRGIRWYDFMGGCETYKMKWGSSVYTKIKYALYNKTARGRLALLRETTKRRAESIAGRFSKQ